MYAPILIAMVLAGAAVEADGPEAQIAAEVQASLPIDLAVVAVSVVGDASWGPAARLSVSWPHTARAGTVMVPVMVEEGGAGRRVWAAVKLGALCPVLVTARPLALGAALEASDLKIELRPVARGDGLDLTLEALVGQAVLRDLAEGEVLGRRDVALPVPMPRGTPVTVVSSVGGARVEVPGTLATAARPGERARVRVAMSTRLLHGRMVGRDRFQLEVLP